MILTPLSSRLQALAKEVAIPYATCEEVTAYLQQHHDLYLVIEPGEDGFSAKLVYHKAEDKRQLILGLHPTYPVALEEGLHWALDLEYFAIWAKPGRKVIAERPAPYQARIFGAPSTGVEPMLSTFFTPFNHEKAQLLAYGTSDPELIKLVKQYERTPTEEFLAGLTNEQLGFFHDRVEAGSEAHYDIVMEMCNRDNYGRELGEE
jgi:hypothetical protein